MDPVTQGALGAILPQSISVKLSRKKKYHAVLAGFFGMVGGIAADIDVLISSETDPLLFLTFHRQFTHSLVFIPFGGLIVAFLLHWALGRRWRLKFYQTALLCTLGYTTHALLDTATSYGTMLLWPFIETRYSLNIISILDPLFTLPLLLSVTIAALYNSSNIARIGLAWALIYLSIGYIQHKDARQTAMNLAASRGHEPIRFEIKPSFGNILVWKSLYQVEDKFFIDAMRVGIAPHIYEGKSISKLDPKRDFPWLIPHSQQAKDINRFDNFNDGFSALDPEDPNRIIDVRYSFIPNDISPLFSIKLTPNANFTEHAHYNTNRKQAYEKLSRLWNMIFD